MKKSSLFSLLLLMTHFIIYAQTTPPARTWYYNKQGSKTTVNERWDEDAQGLKHGTYIQYFENGSRAILGSYSHGKKNGQWEKTRYERDYNNAFGISYNQFYEISTYSNDKLNGLYKNFQIFDSKDRILLDQGNYTNDMRTGFWKLGFDEKTGKFQEGNYVNGTKDGEWKNTKEYYFAEGYKTIFKDGHAVAVYDDKGVDITEIEDKEKAEKTRITNFYKEIDDCQNLECIQMLRTKYPDQIGSTSFNNAEKRALLNDIINMPTIEKLEAFDKKYGEGVRSGELKELNQLLLKSTLIDKTFTFNFNKSTHYDWAVQATLIKILFQNNVPINNTIYAENLIQSIDINQENSIITIKANGLEQTWYEGDHFSTLINFTLNKIFVYDMTNSKCSCDFYANSYPKKVNINWEEIKELKTEEDTLCFLVKSTYAKSYYSLELFLGYQLPLTRLKNAEYKTFLVNQKSSMLLVSLKNEQKNYNKTMIYLSLAYLYWSNGDYETSLKYFKIITTEKLPIIFQQYDSYYANGNPVFEMSNLNQWIKKIHLVYFTNNGIILPNEEEMLKKIKDL